MEHSKSTDPSQALEHGDLAEVFDRLSDGIAVLGHDWRFQYLNEPAAAILGRPVADLLGRQAWQEFPESVGGPFQLAFAEALKTGEPRRLVDYSVLLECWLETRIFPQKSSLVILFRDVTEEQRAEGELRDYVHRISEAERIVGFGVWEWQIASGRVLWSDELHRIYGLRPGEFGGTIDDFVERVNPDDRERVWSYIKHSLETREPFIFEERITRTDGAERTLLSQGRVITGPDGDPTSLVGVCHDITARARVEQALGASERRIRAIIDNTPSVITVKDLEGRFVMANAESERVIGIAAGDLTGMLCVDVFPPDVADAQRANDRLAASEGEPVYDETILVRDGVARDFVTVTFPLPDEGGVPSETCTIATDVTERKERESARREREDWTEIIGSALAEGRLVAFAQPIFDPSTGARFSSELLARMRTPGNRPQLLEPHSFLPACERFGLIQAIDTAMVRLALGLPGETTRHVNLSALTMSDLHARKEIAELLAAAPEAARRVVFEVTETAAAEYLQAARAFADEMTGMGCRFAIDDFGVGFGSFNYLRALPLSFIKIDRSFVANLTDSAEDRRVVKSVIGLAREFDLRTIAEGVEDQATLDLLVELGADYMQGFFLGRPGPLDLDPVGRRH